MGFRAPVPFPSALASGFTGGFLAPVPFVSALASPADTNAGFRSILGFWVGGLGGQTATPSGGPVSKLLQWNRVRAMRQNINVHKP